MDPKLVELLACPVTRQPLALADSALLARTNAAIGHGGLAFGEHRQTTALREALVTRDGEWLYRVDDGIPVLLPEERLQVSALAAA